MAYDNKTSSQKEIDLRQLKLAIDLLFEHLDHDLKLKTIRLDHDYYADIDLQQKFEVLSESSKSNFLDNLDIGLGQLYDDWEFLENMIKENSVTPLMFEHVSPLLRYIGYKALTQSYEREDAPV